MNSLDIFLTWFLIGGWSIVGSSMAAVDHSNIVTAIKDNGCATHQELKQDKTNADTYNYESLTR